LTQNDVVAQPFSYWVGMDTDPRSTPESLAEFNRFYSTTSNSGSMTFWYSYWHIRTISELAQRIPSSPAAPAPQTSGCGAERARSPAAPPLVHRIDRVRR